MNTQGSDLILQRMMALHPKVIDLTLDRMWRLLDALGNPQNNLPPVIHIAGTNGKGSTQAMLRAGLEAAGKTVHAYTSPHLARFHERIRLAGDLITEPALTDLLDECYAANKGETITYFEITTCAALLAFARTPADYTLLEVGLGGRVDATNVIDNPELAIITPISFDHPQFLGTTIAEIAGEKAGILKRLRPAIIAPQPDDALNVIEARAAQLGAPLTIHGQHFHAAPERDGMIFQDENGLLDLPRPNLIGDHQIQNAGTTIAALRHLGFDNAACEAAITRAQWPARMQRLKTGPLVDMADGAELWLDGGHNAACGQATAHALSSLPPRETHLICGMLNTKDVTGFLEPFAPIAKSLTAVAIPGETATLSAEETQSHAQSAGLKATTAETVTQALEQVLIAAPNARVLICGSLYLAGRVLQENG